MSPSAREAQLESGFFKPGLVIFDKDGTLVCFHTMWTPWCTSLAARMNRATGNDMAEQLYDLLGYDHNEQKVRIGPLAENTHPQIRDKIEEMLTISHDMTPKQAKQVVDHTWRETPEDMKIKLTGNLPELFIRLKNQGVKVRILFLDFLGKRIENNIFFRNWCRTFANFSYLLIYLCRVFINATISFH